MSGRSESVATENDGSKTDWLLIALLWFAGIGAAMQFAKFSVGFEVIVSRYGADPALIALALSAVGTVGMIFGASAGMLTASIEYGRVLIPALILGAACSAVQALMSPMAILLTSRFIEGLSHLGIVVAAPTLMVTVSTTRHRSIVMGLWGTFFGVAFAVRLG